MRRRVLICPKCCQNPKQQGRSYCAPCLRAYEARRAKKPRRIPPHETSPRSSVQLDYRACMVKLP